MMNRIGDHMDDLTSNLGKAIARWRSCRKIPLTLATALIEEGYDVGALERHHWGRP